MMTKKHLKILIGDARPQVRFGLRLLLEQQSDWSVTGEAEDAQMLMDHILSGCPDLALVDCELPGMPFGGLVDWIRQACPSLWIVLMSSKFDLRLEAIQAGADFFAYKADPPEKLIELIRGLVKE